MSRTNHLAGMLVTMILFVVTTFRCMSQVQEVNQSFYIPDPRGESNYSVGFAAVDRFWITGAPGITWLKIAASGANVWEEGGSVLYDGVPLVGTEVICPKRYPPCEGCDWGVVHSLHVMAWGSGSVNLRIRVLPEPPYPIEGNYILTDNSDGTYMWEPTIIVNPSNLQPGNTANVRVTIPLRMRQHISGVTLQLPVPPETPPNYVTLPYDPDGVYDYSWTVPPEKYYEYGHQTPVQIVFWATSNKKNETGQFYRVTGGSAYLNIASTLSVKMVIQGTEVANGSNNTWQLNRERGVSAIIENGREPFTGRWIINGNEVEVPWEYRIPESRSRAFRDQNALANAGTITFDVTDANGNRTSATIYMGIKTGMDFEIQVQGRVVEPGSTVEWKEESQRMLQTRQLVTGQLPYKVRWLVNGTEYMSLVSRQAMFQYQDQDALKEAGSVTFEVTDANQVQKSYTVYFKKTGTGQQNDTIKVPSGPVGPAPTPPPLMGNPNREPDPTVPWNDRPWLDERVRQCARQYLQNIILYMVNETIKWENTGRSPDKQETLFTTIDDWGRMLKPNMSTSGGVDGNWDNPTHFVWSVFNKPDITVKYGRTVDYYCKYECALLEPSPDNIDNAIKDVTKDNENEKWDSQRVRDAISDLNALLQLMRTLYNKFNINYDKFVNEINDQNSNPLENEIIALCIATAGNLAEDHSVKKDTLDLNGNALIVQSATNKEINMLEIISMISEVQLQADDMSKKLAEMKRLLLARGGDVDEITSNGERLIAQGNVNPEVAQDGGVNVEFFGDAVDNFGDGLQDYLHGNVRRGNVLFVLWDGGNIADDIFELVISGMGSQGTTPAGGRRNFDITLNSGTYTVTIRGVYTDPNSPPCTFGLQIYDRELLILQEVNSMEQGQEMVYTITVR